jgi:calcium-binding protein CML
LKIIQINPKNINLNPKHLFRSKKSRSSPSKDDPSSFGSVASASSSSSSSSDASTSHEKPRSGLGVADLGTPRSVLPRISGDWSDSSADIQLDQVQAMEHGVVTRKELEALLSRLGVEPPSEEELTMMLREVGGDGEGCISLEALLSRVGSACDSELREAFDFFDADHDGRISAEELLGVFRAIGDRCTLEDCRRMIAGVDKNGDGFVCFEDFSQMMGLQRCSQP